MSWDSRSDFNLKTHHVRVLLALRAAVLVLEILVQEGSAVGHATNEHLLGQEVESATVYRKALNLNIYLVRLGCSPQPDGYVFIAPICRIYDSSQERKHPCHITHCLTKSLAKQQHALHHEANPSWIYLLAAHGLRC